MTQLNLFAQGQDLPLFASSPDDELHTCDICGEEFSAGFGTVADGFATCHECEERDELDTIHYARRAPMPPHTISEEAWEYGDWARDFYGDR